MLLQRLAVSLTARVAQAAFFSCAPDRQFEADMCVHYTSFRSSPGLLCYMQQWQFQRLAADDVVYILAHKWECTV